MATGTTGGKISETSVPLSARLNNPTTIRTVAIFSHARALLRRSSPPQPLLPSSLLTTSTQVALLALSKLLLLFVTHQILFATMTKLSFENMGEFSQTRANELYESHKKFLEWRKTEWATRGPDALAKRQAMRASTHTSWRQMKGFNLFSHEFNHAGNKPFAIGFVVMGGLYLWAFSGQDTTQSEYWTKYHSKK